MSDIFVKLGIEIDVNTFNRLFVDAFKPQSIEWTCTMCTFINKVNLNRCAVCNAPKEVSMYR